MTAFPVFRKGASGRFVVIEAIEQLIRITNAPHILLSYSSGGRATAQDLLEVVNAYGNIIDARKIDYKKNVMAAMKWTNDWVKKIDEKHYEYLFLIQKR